MIVAVWERSKNIGCIGLCCLYFFCAIQSDLWAVEKVLIDFEKFDRQIEQSSMYFEDDPARQKEYELIWRKSSAFQKLLSNVIPADVLFRAMKSELFLNRWVEERTCFSSNHKKLGLTVMLSTLFRGKRQICLRFVSNERDTFVNRYSQGLRQMFHFASNSLLRPDRIVIRPEYPLQVFDSMGNFVPDAPGVLRNVSLNKMRSAHLRLGIFDDQDNSSLPRLHVVLDDERNAIIRIPFDLKPLISDVPGKILYFRKRANGKFSELLTKRQTTKELIYYKVGVSKANAFDFWIRFEKQKPVYREGWVRWNNQEYAMQRLGDEMERPKGRYPVPMPWMRFKGMVAEQIVLNKSVSELTKVVFKEIRLNADPVLNVSEWEDDERNWGVARRRRLMLVDSRARKMTQLILERMMFALRKGIFDYDEYHRLFWNKVPLKDESGDMAWR